MTELENTIKLAADAYYKDGSSPYTDEEFDSMMEELKIVNPNSELLKNGVQEDLKGISKKYKLPHTMGTLAKCMDEASFRSMWNKYCANSEIVVESKLDGAGCLLIYNKGKLIQALSRGDTEYGEDITNNIKLIPNVQKQLKEEITCEIRGEFFMRRSIFNKYFKDVAKNPRNMAAGLIKRLDGADCDKLSFFAYDLWSNNIRIDTFTELGKLSFLKENGFETPQWWAGISYEDVLKLRNQLITDGEIPCDGLVIKQNTVDKSDLERRTPMKNFAFKPAPSLRTTKVNKIIWQLAGSQFAPVAEVEPVELCGTTVERATLSNVNIMNKLGIYEGANVLIKKSGEVIPEIVEVTEPKKNAFSIPTKCPVCGGVVEVNCSGFPVCTNPSCNRKLNHRFAKMFEILGIKGCGDAFLNNVEQECSSVKEFLELALAEDKVFDKWAGGINGRKIIKQLKKALNTPITIPQFLATFDYKGFDEKKIKLIDKNLEEMYSMSVEDLKKVNGFGDITANMFVEFLTSYRKEIESLIPFFKFKSAVKQIGKLTGLSFCFTGEACRPRSELQKIVEDNGGTNKSGVAKGLSYLVNDDIDSTTSKNIKAKSLGIPIISSTQFLNMV